MQDYFKRPVHQILVVRPLNEINASTEYDVKCRVTGGGLSGQAGAIIHGLSRALVSIDGGLKKTLNEAENPKLTKEITQPAIIA